MAIAGDVVIRLAADFAQFASGMDASIKKLEQFGQSASKTGSSIETFIGQVRGAFAALGAAAAVQQAVQYLEGLQKSTAAMATQAQNIGMSAEAFQTYKAAALDAGTTTDAITTAIAKFNVTIGQAAQGNKAQIEAFDDLGVKLLDASGKLRSFDDVLQETAVRLLAMPEGTKRAAAEVALFGRSGQALNPILQQLAQGVVTLTERYRQMGLIISDDVVKASERMERAIEISKAKIDVMIATLYLPIRETALSHVASVLENIATIVKGFDIGRLDHILKLLGAIMNPAQLIALYGGASAANDPLTPVKKTLDEIATIETEVQAIQARLDAARTRNSQTRIQSQTAALSEANARLEEARRRNAEALATAAERTRDTGGLQPPPVPPAGTTQVPVRPTGGGGGGGKTDADNIEAQIARYKALSEAALKSYDLIRNSQSKRVEDLERELKVQQAIDDTAAKLGAKYAQAGPVLQAQLRAEIELNERRRELIQDYKRDLAAAQALNERLGSGDAARRRREETLERARRGGAEPDALRRARVQQEEADREQERQARRYDDNLGSIGAGFESAAEKFARANDLYTMGGQAFEGLTTAMGDALDVLAGKSDKTFEDIALSFAKMLADMAMRAALSQVFNAILGAFSGGIPTPGSQGINVGAVGPSGMFPRRAAGGPVEAGRAYTVGEYGPETFIPSASGRIEPYSPGKSGGDVTVNIDMGGNRAEGTNDPSRAVEFGRKIQVAIKDVIQNEKRPGGMLYSRVTA